VRPGLVVGRRMYLKTIEGTLPIELSLLTYEGDQGGNFFFSNEYVISSPQKLLSKGRKIGF